MAAPASFTALTVDQAVTEYLVGVERRVLTGNLAQTTAANYRRDLSEFVSLAGAQTILDDLSADAIDDIVLAYAAQPDKRFSRREKPSDTAWGRGPGAQARFRQSISSLFARAERMGWVQRNPMPDTQVRPRAKDLRASTRSALDASSARALLESGRSPAAGKRPRADMDLGARDTAILAVLLEVGVRVSELVALDMADVTQDDGVTWLRIRHGKGGKERSVPLSPATTRAVLDYVADARPKPVEGAPFVPALFLTYRGKRMSPRDVQNLVHRAMDRVPAELRRAVTPHGLRHTAATILLASGAADVGTVKNILGHESLATTGVYLDADSQAMARAVRDHPVTATPPS